MALLVALGLAVLAVLRSGREPVLVTCTWLYGAGILVATPVYPWYAMPLLVLAVLAARWEWLTVWLAAYVAFVFDHLVAAQAAAYGSSLIIVGVAVLRRGAIGSASQVVRPDHRSGRDVTVP